MSKLLTGAAALLLSIIPVFAVTITAYPLDEWPSLDNFDKEIIYLQTPFTHVALNELAESHGENCYKSGQLELPMEQYYEASYSRWRSPAVNAKVTGYNDQYGITTPPVNRWVDERVPVAGEYYIGYYVVCFRANDSESANPDIPWYPRTGWYVPIQLVTLATEEPEPTESAEPTESIRPTEEPTREPTESTEPTESVYPSESTEPAPSSSETEASPTEDGAESPPPSASESESVLADIPAPTDAAELEIAGEGLVATGPANSTQTAEGTELASEPEVDRPNPDERPDTDIPEVLYEADDLPFTGSDIWAPLGAGMFTLALGASLLLRYNRM